MRIYYSPSKGGFYNTDFFAGPTMIVASGENGELTQEVDNPDCNMPSDVVEVTAERHAELFAGQAEGKNIIAGKDGKPVLADRPAPSKEDVEANMRVVRNRELANTDGIASRHRDEKDMGASTTITDKAFKDVLTYRQALRDLPENIKLSSDFEVALPAKPAALA